MGTVRLGTFPSLNNKNFQDDIAKALLTWFIHRFPVGTFNHIYLDTQTTTANAYQMNNATGELQKIVSGEKILQPALRMNVKQGPNNHSEVFGSLWNVNQQPGAFAIDTDLTGSKPFLYDPYGIILATNEYTIRNQFDIVIDLQTKADQLAFYNICDNNLKNLYVQTIEADAGIIIPSLLIEYIRKSVFKPELEALDKMIADSDEKNQYKQKINDMFSKYLYDYSGHAIKPFREQNVETGVTNYLYKLNRKQLLTFHIDKAEGDEGTKKGGAYTSFQITMSGWLEYGNPIAFMSSVPAIVRGTKNDHFIRTSSKTDAKNNYHIMEFKEVFKDDRRLLDVNGKIWTHFYFEREIMMASNTENFNILDDVIVEEDTPSHYYIMKALLSKINTKEEFNKLFKVIIYKNNTPLDKKFYSIDEKFNFIIKDCDLSIPYYIDIFVNREAYAHYMEIIDYELRSIGIEIDRYESNSHFRRNGYYYHPKYIDQRGYYYSTKLHEGSVPEENERNVIFIPIKYKDFLKADPSYDYFVLSVDQHFIPVKDEVLEKRPDLDFYIMSSDIFLKIDRERVLIPDDRFTYYIFDKSSRTYKVVKDLTEFDKTQQYYIRQENIKSITIDVSCPTS